MGIPELARSGDTPAIGYGYVAVSVGSLQAVDALTDRMREAGVRVTSEPRLTGDGYYESVVEDPDGNSIEIVA